jgi:GDP-4-dehydro-6-deoxy-D-mannose reductase
MKVLITGALGFTGRHLARRLASEPDVTVFGVDRIAAVPEGLGFAEYQTCDITADGAIAALVARIRPDWIFHLSGLFTGPLPELYRANLISVIELLESVSAVGYDAKVLVIGSAAEYGLVGRGRMPITEDAPCAPVNMYGRTKHAATVAALEYARRGVKVAVARPFNLIGAGVPAALVVGAVLDRIAQALERGDEEVRVGNLDCERDFVAVNDVIDGYLALMAREPWGRVFNLCSGRPATIRSVVATLLSYAPRPLHLVVDPVLCRPDDVPVVYGSWERAHRAFGFMPATPLEGALRMAWDHRLGRGESR